MKIELHFPTPIYSHDSEENEISSFFDELNHTVAQEHNKILKREDARSRHYTQSRHIDHRQVIDDYGLENFQFFLLRHCKVFLSQLDPQAQAIDIRESWFNFYEPGDFQAFHNHVHATTPSYLSGVFYWQAPEKSGDLTFYQPNISNAVASTGFERSEVNYPPKPYRLILFRSHVPHAVMPNTSDQQRISISFNIYVQ